MDLATIKIGDEELNLDMEEATENEPDLPPEYCHYRDEGCEFSDSCLNCPFLQCLYDEPRGKQRWLKELRDKQIARLFSGGDWGVKELALLFGLSQRTIQRALKSTLPVLSSRCRGKPDKREELNKGE